MGVQYRALRARVKNLVLLSKGPNPTQNIDPLTTKQKDYLGPPENQRSIGLPVQTTSEDNPSFSIMSKQMAKWSFLLSMPILACQKN